MLDVRHRAKYFTNLLEAGVAIKTVKVPEHSSGPISYARLIHAKYTLIDGEKLWMSTSNMGGGYFYDGRNLAIQVESPVFANEVGSIFSKYWNAPFAKSMTQKEAVDH